ncbi:MAG: AAA family ATPase [Clostridia bacterium]|nr:AAA family ATPase [Clostridia bacterium]
MLGFEEIVGHKEQIDFLQQALKMGKLSHSYIFEGISGIGKKAIALAFAKIILNNEGSFDSGNHPDFMLIEPDGRSIKNEQIEQFQEFVSIKPYRGDSKVILIDDASTMTVSAQNRILKTLEEAPKNVVIIFVCETVSALLPTIVSRCQTLSFSRLDNHLIADYLKNVHELSEEEASVYSQFGDGSLKKAVDAVVSEDFKEARANTIKLLMALHKGERANVITWVDVLLKLELPTADVFDLMETCYRDLMLLLVFGLPERVMNKDYMDELNVCGQMLQRKKLIKYIEAIESAKKMLKENVNEAIAFDGLVITLQEG